MSRFYTHMKGLFFRYRTRSDIWRNKHFEDKWWQIKEEWIVGIRLERKWFDKYNVYYDGHTVDSITVLGVQLSKAYTYESKSLAEWIDEEHNTETV